MNNQESIFDSTQAMEEGWLLFDDGELQTWDLSTPFESDAEALQFVIDRAMENSEYHIKALEYRERHAEGIKL